MVFRCEARSADIKWGGGGLFLWDYDSSAEVRNNKTTGVMKKTTLRKNVVFNMYWLDADAKINDDLSFSARLSNMSAAKWNALMVEGTGSSGSEVVAFQHAYASFNAPSHPSLKFNVGLLPVDRNMEPLQAHFTPQQTSWSSFWKATMGNIEGVNVQFPVHSGATKIKGGVTVSKFQNGTGRKVVSQTGVPDVVVPDNDQVDTIVSFPVSRGAFQFTPLAALRYSVSGLPPRATYGFTSSYVYSPRFNISLGTGFSSCDTGYPRGSADPNAQDNRTMFLRFVPAFGLGKGQLMLDMKYSTYLDRNAARNVFYRYPVVDLKYSFKMHENLTIVFPFVRYLGASYKDPNTNIHYSKDRVCTYFVVVVVI